MRPRGPYLQCQELSQVRHGVVYEKDEVGNIYVHVEVYKRLHWPSHMRCTSFFPAVIRVWFYLTE